MVWSINVNAAFNVDCNAMDKYNLEDKNCLMLLPLKL